MALSNLDLGIFIIYFIIIAGIGLYLSFRTKNKDSSDYFLAGKSLTWWAIGGSLLASNISAEQFIGMSGSGFKIGLAIASYEFIAAMSLIVIAWFFIPVFLKQGIFTMPQFIEQRYNKGVRTFLAVLWLFLFVFINITSVLYLGALTLQATLGTSILVGVILLAIYSATFSVFGGLKVVVSTDIIQVVVLVIGGTLTTIWALDAYGDGAGVWTGLQQLYTDHSDRFNMILFKEELIYQTDQGSLKDAWIDLPGLSVILGGMWVAHFYYWGMNQYIIQRALAAKNLKEARKGIVFASFTKIFMPLIVVLPGIIAYAMQAPIEKGDQVYSWVLNSFVPIGFKGICFAAIVAAVGSSISSMANSISTIFTLDIYQPYIEKEATENKLVKVGRMAALAALVIGILIAPALANLDQAFQYIQKYTGYLSPGILVVFLFGLFWKRATANAAMTVIISSLILSLSLDMAFEDHELPFLDQMGISFVSMSVLMIVVSMLSKGDDPKAVQLDADLFKTSPIFKLSALSITLILAAIYALFW